MKKLFIFIPLIAVSLFSGFAMAKNGKKVSVTGVVEYYGSGPFACPGLKTDEGKIYSLTGEENLVKEIGSVSGTLVTVKGILTGRMAPAEMPGCPVLEVKSWKNSQKK